MCQPFLGLDRNKKRVNNEANRYDFIYFKKLIDCN